jgi:NAD-dependent dihydropyrimidine dehydrogenase PreA subunit
VEGATIVLPPQSLAAGALAGGDHYVRWEGAGWVRIADNTAERIVPGPEAEGANLPATGGFVNIGIRLQQPYVDPRACIGCGICEHECPVHGLRAIRVSSENESRHLEQRLILS